MPQATNRQLVRDMNNTPVGTGTVYNTMLKISAATRERAKKVNEGEQLRLGKVTRVMERHQRMADHAQSKVLERVQKQLKDLQAFQVVLRDKYSIDNFHTLKPPPQCMSDRRRRLETMFYTSGFSQKSMQPEIKRQLRRTDPERLRRKLKRHLLESSRQDVVRLAIRNAKNFESSGLKPRNDASINDVTSALSSDDVIDTVVDANGACRVTPTHPDDRTDETQARDPNISDPQIESSVVTTVDNSNVQVVT